MKISASGITDIGNVRSTNEDYYGILPEVHLYIVADGMGGHAGGEVASRMAIETAVKEFTALSHTGLEDSFSALTPSDLPPPARHLATAVQRANRAIFNLGAERPDLSGMGTTIVALLIAGETGYIAHVGDSRAYVIRKETITQLTTDHSLVSEYLEKGYLTSEAAQTHPLKHVLSRALGTQPSARVSVTTQEIREDDLFLLCTDGLTNSLSEKDMLSAFPPPDGNLDIACKRLIAMANEKGGEDNMTLILVRCGGA